MDSVVNAREIVALWRAIFSRAFLALSLLKGQARLSSVRTFRRFLFVVSRTAGGKIEWRVDSDSLLHTSIAIVLRSLGASLTVVV